MSKAKNTRRAHDFGEREHNGFKNGHQEKLFDTTPYEGDSTTTTGKVYTPSEIETGKERLRAAWAWRRINRQAWSDAIAHLGTLAAKSQRVSASALGQFIVDRDYVGLDGSPTGCNHNFYSIISRWLTIEHPEWHELIELRSSVYDTLDVGASL